MRRSCRSRQNRTRTPCCRARGQLLDPPVTPRYFTVRNTLHSGTTFRILVALLTLAAPALAQGAPATPWTRDTIQSAKLNELRTILVAIRAVSRLREYDGKWHETRSNALSSKPPLAHLSLTPRLARRT